MRYLFVLKMHILEQKVFRVDSRELFANQSILTMLKGSVQLGPASATFFHYFKVQ